MRWNHYAIGYLKFRLIGQRVGQVVTADVGRERVRIIKLEPIVKMSVCRIGLKTAVGRHPFIDQYIYRRGIWIIRRPWRDKLERAPAADAPVRIGAIGTPEVWNVV